MRVSSSESMLYMEGMFNLMGAMYTFIAGFSC